MVNKGSKTLDDLSNYKDKELKYIGWLFVGFPNLMLTLA